MAPSATIVIPARNSQGTVALTIESALSQDWPGPLEVIVIDNGSTDSTAPIAARYPVRCISEPEPGRSGARNRGRREASGDVLGFADSDCELPRSWLSDSWKLLLRPWVGAVQARIGKRGAAPPADDFVHARWYLPFLDTCALVTTREAFDAARGLDTELRRNVDMDFSFRLLACGYALAIVKALAIKHHDLSYRQVLRRGWDGGSSAALVDAKWRSLSPPAAKRRLIATRGWVRSALLRAPFGPSPGREVVEHTAKLVGYLATDVAPWKPTENAYRPVTRLPELLGPRRSLVVLPGGALLYDGEHERIERIDEVELAVLETMLTDGRGRVVERVGAELGVTPDVVEAAAARLERRIAH